MHAPARTRGVIYCAGTYAQREHIPYDTVAVIKIEPGFWLHVGGFVHGGFGGFVGYTEED